jgi:NADH-quinone oxidoreductase subunit N
MSPELYWTVLRPEITLVVGAVLCMIFGVGRQSALRKLVAPIGLITLLIAMLLSWPQATSQGNADAPVGLLADSFAGYLGLIATAVGALIFLVNWHLPVKGERGEFFGLILFSVAGVILTGRSDDLITLFLGLELTSVPTYVLIALSSNNLRAPEASGKYFFLGAMSAAIMVYGFSFIYGVTGTTIIGGASSELGLRGYVLADGLSNPILLIGLVLSVGGLAFKLAAVPFHFYAADVYQGAASPVTGLLGFLPKAAGFAALIRLVVFTGATDHAVVFWTLWIICLATMTTGNVLALLQRNVKRILAYSSIAHSGYMLIGVLVGPALASDASLFADGVAAVLFYLAVYGVMNLGAFAVLSYLIRRRQPAEELSDLYGLWRAEPVAALALATCVFSLMGFPPTAGFAAKVFIFSSAFSLGPANPFAGAMVVLAVLGVINAAIGAAYYLRIVAACYLDEEREPLDYVPSGTLRFGVTLCALITLAFGIWPRDLMQLSRQASSHVVAESTAESPADAPPEALASLPDPTDIE